MLTDDGPVAIDVPRDRDGTFEPQLIGKHECRLTGFDQQVIALYARGLTVREIQAFLSEAYAVDVSPDLASAVTDAVVAEVTAWQSRPLEPLYPVVFFDALRVKIRDEATVRIKVYLALAVLPDGSRDILGIWIEQTEGAKILAEGLHGPESAGLSGHPDRGHRRRQRHGRGAGRRVPADDAADVHRASAPSEPGLRELEAAESRSPWAPHDLRSAHRRARARRAGRL